VSQFRNLMAAVFGSGALAGLVLFAIQYFTVVPLIKAVETYEAAGHEAHSGASHEDEGWQPAEGWQRTSFTALTTVLTGIGFAAMLFGVMALAGKTINTRRRRGGAPSPHEPSSQVPAWARPVPSPSASAHG
jgi:predicted cobalt transporter CbtA